MQQKKLKKDPISRRDQKHLPCQVHNSRAQQPKPVKLERTPEQTQVTCSETQFKIRLHLHDDVSIQGTSPFDNSSDEEISSPCIAEEALLKQVGKFEAIHLVSIQVPFAN